jgi:two-component sensor histidine kinase/ABC-type amino acid transport substrate-binding protein
MFVPGTKKNSGLPEITGEIKTPDNRDGLISILKKKLSMIIKDQKSSQLMNKFYPLFLCLILIQILINPVNGEKRTIRIGLFPAAPLVMVQEDKPQGLFIDLIDHFSQTLDWEVEYVPGTWNELLKSLMSGKIDLLPAVGYTKKRTEVYDYNKNPIYLDYGVLFTSPELTIHTIFDLQGKRVAALEGSIFTTGFLNYISSFGIKCSMIMTKDNIEVMRAIVNGDADAGVCIYSLGNELAKEYKVAITPISFSPIALHFAAAKNKNSDLIADIDKIMQGMIGNPDSTYSRSFRKWTMPQQNGEIPEEILWGTLGLLITGLILGLLSFILKRQVNSKTKFLQLEISERKQAEVKIKQSLDEKETLIRELYHRTKNTLQVIRGMIVLQADYLPVNKDIQLLVKNTDDRIQVISLVHQMLYKSKDLSHISIKDYIEELTATVIQKYQSTDDRIMLNLKIDDQFFLLDTAIPFGLILNELLTNSLQHGFTDNRMGAISINLKRISRDKSILEYSDNGTGAPDEFDFRNSGTLGLKLIYSIGENQLMGKVTFINKNGITCLIEFNTSLYKARI